jgi:hypothetical protein
MNSLAPTRAPGLEILDALDASCRKGRVSCTSSALAIQYSKPAQLADESSHPSPSRCTTTHHVTTPPWMRAAACISFLWISRLLEALPLWGPCSSLFILLGLFRQYKLEFLNRHCHVGHLMAGVAAITTTEQCDTLGCGRHSACYRRILPLFMYRLLVGCGHADSVMPDKNGDGPGQHSDTIAGFEAGTIPTVGGSQHLPMALLTWVAVLISRY